MNQHYSNPCRGSTVLAVFVRGELSRLRPQQVLCRAALARVKGFLVSGARLRASPGQIYVLEWLII